MKKFTKVFSFLLASLLVLSGSICYAQGIVDVLGEATTGEWDINYDGKMETIIIEKDIKVPGVVTKLVILNKEGEPLFYLSNLNQTNVYRGLKGLKEREKEINESYHKVFYEKRKIGLWHPLIPDEKIHIERPKKSGIEGLDEFEERLAAIWIKSKKLNKAGALSFGKRFYGFMVYAGNHPTEGYASLTISPVNSEGKGIADDFDYIWDTKTKSYMNMHKYFSREDPDYPF